MRVLGCQCPLSEGWAVNNASSKSGDRSSESNASKTSTSVSRLSSYSFNLSVRSNGVLSTFLDPWNTIYMHLAFSQISFSHPCTSTFNHNIVNVNEENWPKHFTWARWALKASGKAFMNYPFVHDGWCVHVCSRTTDAELLCFEIFKFVKSNLATYHWHCWFYSLINQDHQMCGLCSSYLSELYNWWMSVTLPVACLIDVRTYDQLRVSWRNHHWSVCGKLIIVLLMRSCLWNRCGG